MKTLRDYPIQELKLIYQLLHANVKLLDSKYLQDLQQHLLQQAEISGVDISQRTSWANWLNFSEN